MESERRLAQLVEKRPSILSGGKIHDNAPKLNYRNSHAADFRDMELETDGEGEQRSKAILGDAKILIERATRSLHGKADPKGLTDKEEDS